MIGAFPTGSGESRAEAQRRGGVFDLAMGVGRFHALIPTFGGNLLDIPFPQTDKGQARAIASRLHPLVGPRLSRTPTRTRTRSPNFS